MRKRYIDTRFWYDRKVRACSWLEKQVLLHLQLREEMTTIGAITTTIESMGILLNGESRRNYTTPEFPWIEEKHIESAVRSIRKRLIVDVQSNAGLTVYFYNFLNYNSWGPTVYRGFPSLVKNQIPEGPIQEVIRERTIGWMGENGVEIPEPWR